MDAVRSPGDELFLSSAMPCAGKSTFASHDPVLLTKQTQSLRLPAPQGFPFLWDLHSLIYFTVVHGDGEKLEKYIKC